jgi:indole-3-glycerol phosphate synthase
VNALDPIIAATREELARRRDRVPDNELEREAARRQGELRPFAQALARPGLSLIAEHKRRSPSAGVIRADLRLEDVVGSYERGGAAALSILTEGPSFGGSLEDLRAARAASALPILRKDFVVDAYQLHEALAAGADAILLIVAALPDDAHLDDLHALATDLGLTVLVEAHDDAELERALKCGARVVGVNARNLGSFDEDLGVGEGLAGRLPGDVIAVAESAIRSVADAERMAAAGFDAVLVGEMLVRARDATETVRGLAAVTRRGR